MIAQYADHPLRLPFELHLVALALAAVIVLTLPETVTVRSRRPLTLRLEVPEAERAVFWRVLVPSGALFSLFDGTALSLIPVFLVRTLGGRQLRPGRRRRLPGAGLRAPSASSPSRASRPDRAIGWGLAAAALASLGVVAAAPAESAPLALTAVAATGAAAGLVFKGGIDLCTQIAPVQDRGKLLSAYYVACYLGGFSVPLLLIGILSDTDRPDCRPRLPVGRRGGRRGLDLDGRAALPLGAAPTGPGREPLPPPGAE